MGEATCCRATRDRDYQARLPEAQRQKIRERKGLISSSWRVSSTPSAEELSPDWAVRDFLDSRSGRHFADEVANELVRSHDLKAAIETAVDRWMRWTTNRRTAREYGIPRGLPYLTGFVAHCEIMAEPG